VEDVVTTGGAGLDAIAALRDAGLVCDAAVCVVDREEGGTGAFAEAGVELVSLFTVGGLLGTSKGPANPHG
jgi:orotate phosphoribosyltransferase